MSICMYISLLHSAHLCTALVTDPPTHSRWLMSCHRTDFFLTLLENDVRRFAEALVCALTPADCRVWVTREVALAQGMIDGRVVANVARAQAASGSSAASVFGARCGVSLGAPRCAETSRLGWMIECGGVDDKVCARKCFHADSAGRVC